MARRISRRRAAYALAASLAAASAPPGPPGAPPAMPQAALWIRRTCAGCERDIWYLPGQRANACAWAGCPRAGIRTAP